MGTLLMHMSVNLHLESPLTLIEDLVKVQCFRLTQRHRKVRESVASLHFLAVYYQEFP